jgi:hypothetical protein
VRPITDADRTEFQNRLIAERNSTLTSERPAAPRHMWIGIRNALLALGALGVAICGLYGLVAVWEGLPRAEVGYLALCVIGTWLLWEGLFSDEARKEMRR